MTSLTTSGRNSRQTMSFLRKRASVGIYLAAAAQTFIGALFTYRSGSLAHGTANCSVHHRDQGLDADCGVVLDRRVHTLFGPDGIGLGPNSTVNEMVEHLKPTVSPRTLRR